MNCCRWVRAGFVQIDEQMDLFNTRPAERRNPRFWVLVPKLIRLDDEGVPITKHAVVAAPVKKTDFVEVIDCLFKLMLHNIQQCNWITIDVTIYSYRIELSPHYQQLPVYTVCSPD